MTDWRRYACVGNGYHILKKAPAKSPERAQTVPPWEKNSSSEVSSQRLADAQNFPHIFDRVAEWDDSAGQEALYYAMLRHWLKMNGQPCRVPLPDPDMYIDEIEWSDSSKIDPALLKGLNKAPRVEIDRRNLKKTNVLYGFEKPVQHIEPAGRKM